MTVAANPLTPPATTAGPPDTFATVLRAAIDASGLGLARIHDHLRRRGVSVSIATLSYWQNGHSVPGRRSTLAALAHLEEVLRVQPGALTTWVPRAAKFARAARPLRTTEQTRQFVRGRGVPPTNGTSMPVSRQAATVGTQPVRRQPPAA